MSAVPIEARRGQQTSPHSHGAVVAGICETRVLGIEFETFKRARSTLNAESSLQPLKEVLTCEELKFKKGPRKTVNSFKRPLACV